MRGAGEGGGGVAKTMAVRCCAYGPQAHREGHRSAECHVFSGGTSLHSASQRLHSLLTDGYSRPKTDVHQRNRQPKGCWTGCWTRA